VITVTVITVTISEESATRALREAWPEAEIKELQPLLGGQWAAMARVRISGAPAGVPEDLVLRVVPEAVMGAKELAVQRAAHAAGVTTPMVQLLGQQGGPLGGAWAVMDLAPGRPLLADLNGAAAIRQLPALLRRLPTQLADTMLAVHRIEPTTVENAVRSAAPGAPLRVEDLWHHLHAASGGPLRTALERLWESRPTEGRIVVCHGDLHPFNLLLDEDGMVTVLDWTAALIAPPAYDVAFTWLLLGHPPLAAPAPLRPVIGAGAAVLSRRFLREYRAREPRLDMEQVRWFAGLHACRVLVDLATWRAAGDPRSRSHPWRLVAPGAARALRRATGVRV
jgi:aminoglycoside phosphotransferase (APT) family kinase protein